jgi:cytochrome P450
LHTEVDLQTAELAHHLLRNLKPKRHPALVAKVRSAFKTISMIVADGENWQQTHKALAPFFTPAYTRTEYLPVVTTVADASFSAMRDQIVSSHEESLVIDVERRMRVITARIMGFVLFGRVLTAEDAEYLQDVQGRAMQASGGRLASNVNGWLGAALHVLNRQKYQPVLFGNEQRRAMSAMLGWIVAQLQAADMSGLGSSAPSRPGAPILAALRRRYADHRRHRQTMLIAAEYAMLFIAAIETTASALTFTLSALAQHPAMLARVAQEARAADDGETGPLRLSRFPYILQVFQETLRVSTIVPTMLRISSREDDLSGVRIPQRSTYRILVSRFHRDPKVWQRPGDFDPERFAAPLSPVQRAHYLPFGSGPNICLGRDLALLEAVVILVAFFRHLDIAPGAVTAIARKDTIRTALDTIRPKPVLATVRAAPWAAGG